MSVLTTNYLTPTGREEAWRFTPLKRLRGLHDGSAVVADRNSLVTDLTVKALVFRRSVSLYAELLHLISDLKESTY